VVTTIINLK